MEPETLCKSVLYSRTRS